MKRRTFLKTVGGAAGVTAVSWTEMFGAEASRPILSHPSGLPRRVLGRTQEAISIIGFPGLALSRLSQDDSNAAYGRRMISAATISTSPRLTATPRSRWVPP